MSTLKNWWSMTPKQEQKILKQLADVGLSPTPILVPSSGVVNGVDVVGGIDHSTNPYWQSQVAQLQQAKQGMAHAFSKELMGVWDQLLLADKYSKGAVPTPTCPPLPDSLAGLVSEEAWQKAYHEYVTAKAAQSQSLYIAPPDLPFNGALFAFDPLPKVYHQSGKDDWATPDLLYSQIVTIFGEFDLDPCADITNTKCPMWFTESQNGLDQKWFGKVFVNPPYSKVKDWVYKACDSIHYGHCDQVVMLVASRTDTKWWAHMWGYAKRLLFLQGRVTFVGAKSGAPFPSAVVELRRTDYGPDQTGGIWASDENPIVVWNWKAGLPPPLF